MYVCVLMQVSLTVALHKKLFNELINPIFTATQFTNKAI